MQAGVREHAGLSVARSVAFHRGRRYVRSSTPSVLGGGARTTTVNKSLITMLIAV
jgi:hypothetical protein